MIFTMINGGKKKVMYFSIIKHPDLKRKFVDSMIFVTISGRKKVMGQRRSGNLTITHIIRLRPKLWQMAWL